MIASALQIRAENIIFADANVKALCVANWDADHDGELSSDEAARLTTLGTVFRGKTNISTFTELKYFTGLTAINDYAFYRCSVQTIEFPSSVTAIGEYAFCESKISGELIIPGTVKQIGDYAFNSCQWLTGVSLEEGVETIGWHSFSGPIRTLYKPSSLSYMSPLAINPYVDADPSVSFFIPEGDLYVQVGTQTPAAIDNDAFYYVFGSAHLIVPFGTVEAYKAVPGWSHFGEYLQAGDVNGDGALNVKDVVSLSAHIMGSRPSPFDERLADVNGDGKINVKDVTLVCNWIMQRNGNQN